MLYNHTAYIYCILWMTYIWLHTHVYIIYIYNYIDACLPTQCYDMHLSHGYVSHAPHAAGVTDFGLCHALGRMALSHLWWSHEASWVGEDVDGWRGSQPAPLFVLASGNITDFILNASGRHAGSKLGNLWSLHRSDLNFQVHPVMFSTKPYNIPHWSCPLSISLAILASQEPKLRGDLWSLAAPTIGQCRGHSSPCLLLCHWAAVECIGGGMVSGRQWGYHYLGQDAYQSSWFSRISLTLAFVLICSLWRYMLLTVCSTCFWGCCSIWQRVRQTPRFQCLLHSAFADLRTLDSCWCPDRCLDAPFLERFWHGQSYWCKKLI